MNRVVFIIILDRTNSNCANSRIWVEDQATTHRSPAPPPTGLFVNVDIIYNRSTAGTTYKFQEAQHRLSIIILIPDQPLASKPPRPANCFKQLSPLLLLEINHSV